MKILITGNRGYLGRVLHDLLRGDGHDVGGFDIGLFEANFASSLCDIRDIKGSDIASFDAVVHLAAVCNDACGELSASATHAINHAATVRLATLARNVGVGRFVLASSCSVYGHTSLSEVDESSQVAPLTAYAASKFAAERALLGLATDGFCPVALRFATLFGPSAAFRSDILLNRMVGTAVRRGVVHVNGPDIRRPMLHVHDAARAIAHVLSAETSLVRVGVYNVGCTTLNHKLDEVADMVRQAVPTAEIRHRPATDQRTYTVRFDRFRDAFPTWSPQRAVDDGAGELASFYGSEAARRQVPAVGWGSTDRLAHLLALSSADLIGPDLRPVPRFERECPAPQA
ncbi:SDR family oxidoreductase [Streptomyces sp. MB09-02B]|uniref:NAD-dependent epimerase/dehydratase family protein n=1 Tax=Streptomyces sp. MB09-02B TaxID=3028667 RepID=UPI0029AD005C|nr:SDR family oxidoreductase [Streptomyces sp. MB09-02B]MDX3639702.1 SDR family oxidoreductase [Streptomyces sp. MB09-02B]